MKDTFRKCMDRMAGVPEYPWHNKDFYAAWLAQTYFYTRMATRILLLAASHCNIEEAVLHRRLSKHSSEETGHEVLAMRDAAELGHDVHKIGEFSSTRAFYATQYYAIQHLGPKVLFGWILFLEGLSVEVGDTLVKRVTANNPKAPVGFLKVHSAEDPEHLTHAFEMIEKFSPEIRNECIANLENSTHEYYHLLNQCKEFAGNKNLKKSA